MSNWNVPEKPSDPSSPSSGGQSPYGAPYPQGGEQQGQSPYGQSPYGQPYPSHGDPIGQHGYWQNPQGGPPGKRPGSATAALVVTFLGAGLAIPGLLLIFALAANEDFLAGATAGAPEAETGIVTGLLRGAAVAGLVLSVLAIGLAFMVARRKNAARIGLTVVAGLAIVNSLLFLPIGIVWMGLCIAGIVTLWVSSTNAWFRH